MIARLTPISLITLAKTLTFSGEKTPITCLDAFDGFESGPSILNIVLIPISFLIGPTFFIALWNFIAFIKPIPVSFIHCSTCFGSSIMFAPSASSKSDAPLFEDAALLPCFATVTPAAAQTNIDVVDMLNELAPSPPVPTKSMYSSVSSLTLPPFDFIISVQPTISSTVSPFMRSAVKNADTNTGDAVPSSIISIAFAASSRVRFCPSVTFFNSSFIIIVLL